MGLFRTRMGGRPLRLIDNQDGSYSVASRPPLFPAMVRTPLNIQVERTFSGYPLFVDKDDTLYYEHSQRLFKLNISDGWGTGQQVLQTSDLSPNVDRFRWFCKTVNSDRYIVSVAQHPDSNGQIWVSDDLQNWEKKLDVSEISGLGDCHFRFSNCWHHFDGRNDIIIVATYGKHSQDNPDPTNHVYLSLDEGETWELIYTSPSVSANDNRHIHAVAYDPWHGWIWVCYGDGNNRGISYTYDMGGNWVQVASGKFGEGGWQPTAVVPLMSRTAFGTDNPIADGVLTREIPRDNGEMPDVGFAWKKLHYTGVIHIARRAMYVSPVEAYIPLIAAGKVTIIATGDGGLSWHPAVTFATGLPFEQGFTNPDSDRWVYGAGYRFRVSEWDSVTDWVEGGHIPLS